VVLLNVPGYSEDHTLVGRLLGLGRRRGDMDGQATDALAIQDKLSVALREIKKNQPGSRIDIPRLLIMLYLNNISFVSFIGAKHSRVDFLLSFSSSNFVIFLWDSWHVFSPGQSCQTLSTILISHD